MSGKIDLDHLEKYVAGDASLRDEILHIFSEQLELAVQELDPTEADAVWRDISHRLKGAARGVGAWKLGSLAEESETLIDGIGAKTEQRAGILLSIRREASAILDHINELRSLAA